jgi:hypothetical protein
MSDVATPRAEHAEMAKRWALPVALMGGTPAMRKQGEVFLPREPAETLTAYERRLSRAVLLNEFSRNLSTLAGYIFAKPVQFKAGGENATISASMQDVIDDVDRDGTPLAEFAQELFEVGASAGLAHVLVDFPVNNGDGSREADMALTLRPYFVLIRPENLIGWRTEQVNGQTFLSQIRYRTWREHSEDEFGSEEMVEQIRVRRVNVAFSEETVFELNADNEWAPIAPATPINLSYIPLATFFGTRTGYMTGKPPFEDLAQMNLRWWQSYADQANILHYARVPFLHIAGGDEEQSVEIGANTAMKTGQEVKIGWVEHKGDAINAGRTDIQDIQEWMVRMSIETYMTRRAATATEAGIDANQSMSLGQLLAVNLSQCITKALVIAADWMDEKFDAKAEFNTKFAIRAANQAAVVGLNAMRDRGDLSRTDYLEQMGKIGVVEDLNIEANDARLDVEGGGLSADAAA